MAVSDAILAQFKSASSDRLRRIEAAWNRSLLEQGGTVSEMLRELHTLKGDAAIVGESSIHQLCQKLEDLVERVDKQRASAPTDELELVVTMAIQFIGMLLRAKPNAMVGLDLDGFMRQIQEALQDTAPATPARTRSTPPRTERLARDTRDRLAIAATAIYLEALAARDDSSRRRLHTAWRSLQRELARLDATEITSVIERHAAAGRDLAHALDKQVEITVHCVEAQVSPQVAEVIDAALLHLVRSAVEHGHTIRIRASMQANDLEIAVTDDGVHRTSEGEVKGELARVGGTIVVDGAGARFRVPARVRRSEVLHFTVPGATLPFAISARWKVGLGRRQKNTIDPLAALGIGKVHERPEASVLRMRWGFHELAMPITAAPVLATAELVCPTPDDQPVEIVLVNGCEALLVRPEFLT